MGYVISYHGKDNKGSYWTIEHGFARKNKSPAVAGLLLLSFIDLHVPNQRAGQYFPQSFSC